MYMYVCVYTYTYIRDQESYMFLRSFCGSFCKSVAEICGDIYTYVYVCKYIYIYICIYIYMHTSLSLYRYIYIYIYIYICHFPPCKTTNGYCGVSQRSAETTNPRKNCADKMPVLVIVAIFYPFSQFCEINISLPSL